ncbi:hypothetical protein B7494_g2335 [Chlorociboria aeruginascens]|nr:hypothetical protein B7494_g2335 [Chlorociboria aeruginascens]
MNKVRMPYDRNLETARLVCRTVDDIETPLELADSYLSAMSPIPLKYLANIAIRSSMSISINERESLSRLGKCVVLSLSIRGETKILGKIDPSQEALVMLEYLRLQKITSVVMSQVIKADLPDLRYQSGFSVLVGLLLVPLSIAWNYFIVFLRMDQVKEVKWVGNPYEKFIKEGTDSYLEPRKSFKTRSEKVGKCRKWTEEQVETAAVLCFVYGKFIEV